MKSGGKWLLLIGFVTLVTAWTVIQLRSAGAPDPENDANLAQLLTLPFTTPEGEAGSLTRWQGKIMVLNFWATWCPPCREEMPEFSSAQEQYGPKGVQFIGIAIDQADNVAEFSKASPVAYPLLIAPPGLPGLMAKLGNPQQALPFTLIISRDGEILFRHLGLLSKADLTKNLIPLL